MYNLNVQFMKRLLWLLNVMFPRCKEAATWVFILLLFICLSEQVVIYFVGLIPSRFYLILGDKDESAFWKEVIRSLALILAIALLKSLRQYVSNVLYVLWRGLITVKLHKLYFKDINFYKLNIFKLDVDNVDQRMTQDVDKLSLSLSLTAATVLVTPFTIGYYTYKCWQVTGYRGPLGVVVFFLVASVVNRFLMSVVARYVVKQEQQEGNFRFKHAQLRVSAESCALYRGGSTENRKAGKELTDLLVIQRQWALRQLALDFSTAIADYSGSILSYLIIAIPIFAGAFDGLKPSEVSQVISQNAFQTIYLISQFTQLIDLSGKVATIIGTTHRLGELRERLQQCDGLPPTATTPPASDPGGCPAPVTDEKVIQMKDLTYKAPGSAFPLVKDLQLAVYRGQHLLISGPSGCGKSSLLRVLGSLWPHSGTVELSEEVGPTGVLFLPQHPYLTTGSLRDQIIFPSMEDELSQQDDVDIHSLLQEVKLEELPARLGHLDAVPGNQWSDILSPGEVQRLSFARLLYHKPRIAVLDEATSAVSISQERELYEACKSRGVTLVSVGHRPSLAALHDVELAINGRDGSWSVRTLGSSTAGDGSEQGMPDNDAGSDSRL